LQGRNNVKILTISITVERIILVVVVFDWLILFTHQLGKQVLALIGARSRRD
jgi:hypothetical protein